jgi:YD repeat-containing protein
MNTMFHTFRLNRKWVALMALMFAIMGGASLLAQAALQSSTTIASAGPASSLTATNAGQGGGAVASSPPNVMSLWGGARESIALKSDGTVWAWGLNSCSGLGSGACGKLGDGTEISRSIPVQVHGPGNVGYLTSITAIMGGEHANYALKSDGTLWAWGGNFVGQLGDGTYTNTVVPVQVSGLFSVTSLGGRGYHNLAVKSDGTVWAWGWNSRGQLGHDTSATPCPAPLAGTCSNVPVQVIGITNPLTVTGGGFFSLALMPDHTLQAWGANEYGELGDGSTTDRSAPVHVSSVLSNVVQVSAGWKHAVALTSDGKAWTWGDNTYGQIGNGITSTKGVSIPIQVPGLSNVIAVSGGDRFTAILKADGTVWTWGWNGFGQLGDGTFTDRSLPVQVLGLTDVILVAARDYHVLVIRSDGSVWAWGSGGNGELGNNDTTDRNTPVQVIFLGITSPPLALGLVGITFSYTVTASGIQPITLTVTNLPAWAVFNSPVISGTPDVTGTFPVTLTATSSAGSEQERLTIFIGQVFVYLPIVIR